MTTLTALGIASLVFIVIFTWRAWVRVETAGPNRQSRRQAMMESWINIVIGFSINMAMNWLLLPLVGADISGGQNFWIGVIFTTVSLVRSFVIRRWAETRIHQFAARAAERIA